MVIYGAGAIGGVIGAHLHASRTPTTLVARGAHLAAMREHGLVLDTADGRQVHRIPVAANASEIEWTDDTVVLLCVKSQQTADASTTFGRMRLRTHRSRRRRTGSPTSRRFCVGSPGRTRCA